MIKIDWNKDYDNEFTCPKCEIGYLELHGFNKTKKKRSFICKSCHSCTNILFINLQKYPWLPTLFWNTKKKIQGFICPYCQTEDIYFRQIDKNKKKIFFCKKCEKHLYDSITIEHNFVYKRYTTKSSPIKPFNFNDDFWDLRALNPNFDDRDSQLFAINFELIKLDWFKTAVKQYINSLAKSVKSNTYGTIGLHLSALRIFSYYLSDRNITGFYQINRSFILDYLAQE